MGRNRYTITEQNKPHFMTCTVVEWLPVFTRPETVNILLNCWQYQRQQAGLKLYGYVILENHLHFIAQADDLNKCVSSFKSYTARQIIDHLETLHVEYFKIEGTNKEFPFIVLSFPVIILLGYAWARNCDKKAAKEKRKQFGLPPIN
jgi:REP element-mobilizing transposase RayT